MKISDKILITGSSGLVGKALVRQLNLQGFSHLLVPSHAELDLIDQAAVRTYFAEHQPQYVFHLAAVVGGIKANDTWPAKFIYDNTLMHCNVIHAAYECGAKKLLFPGSACSYPKWAEQPIKEAAFLSGALEPTNIAYAAAKINGLVMCQSYAKQHGLNVVLPMPTNAYGVGDNFSETSSHVIPALMRRFHEAKLADVSSVTLWGSGQPLREFIYVDDLADALIFLTHNYESAEIINVGTGDEISIADLAKKIAAVVGYKGQLLFDTSKPDGAMRKCLNSERLFSLGWQPRVSLEEGLKKMYAEYARAIIAV